MGNYYYSSNAVDSLISYVLDVKPYHSKLSEIVEEYQFYDTLDVAIDDSKHFTRTKVAGIWNDEMYSNGLFAQAINLPFLKYSKSSKHWNNLIKITSNDTQISNLSSAYYLHHNIGLRSVTLDGQGLVEGIDFHVSHGAFTFDLDAAKQEFKESIFAGVTGDSSTGSQNLIGVPLIKEFSNLFYDEVHGLNGIVTRISPNLDSPDYEEWTVECISAPASPASPNVTYEHVQEVASTSWNVVHSLGSKDLFFQAYVFDTTYGLKPVYPRDVVFLDDNTMNVVFSTPQSGKIKLIKHVESSQTFSTDISSPSNVWEINHNLNSKNLIFAAKAVINGQLKIIYPKKFIMLDDNTVRLEFTNPQQGRIALGKTESYTSATFTQATPSETWSFTNTLRVDSGIFLVYLDDGSVIFPKEVYVNKNLVFIQFSAPQSGKVVFTKIFSSGNENAIFTVTGSETGFAGFAKAGIQFNSKNISLMVIPKDETSSFVKGEKYVLTPSNRIVSHKSYTYKETWSLIKVNPIAYSRPAFAKAGSPVISNFVAKTKAIRQQVMKVEMVNGVWEVSSSIDGPLGAMTTIFDNAEMSFSVSAGTFSPVDGDYFEFEIVNEPPSITNLDLTIGYDIVDYDSTEYDDRLINFDLASLQLEAKNPAILPSYFELVYLGNNEFSVKSYDNKISRTPIGTYANAVTGAAYDNGDIAFTIPATVAYLLGDTFLFDVINPDPYVDPYQLNMKSKRFGFITLYPKSFINTPQQLWTITVTGADEITVSSSICGFVGTGKVSQSYDNGMIHFTLSPPAEGFAIGDRFFVQMNAVKPSYLVYGSLSGFQKPLVVGKWYWNGKIGLKIDKPIYHIEEFTTAGIKSYRKLSTGTVVLDAQGRTIRFISPPRYDSKGDVYLLGAQRDAQGNVTNGFPVTSYKGDQFVPVSSANRGFQKGAIVNCRYYDDMRPEQSVDECPTHHDGFVDFILYDHGNPFPETFNLKFSVRGSKFDLYHANDLLILPNPVDLATQEFLVERAVSDKMYLQTSGKYQELGIFPSVSADQWMPVYLKQGQPFSDESAAVEVFSSLIRKKVGTIKNLDVNNSFYQFVVDDVGTDSFFSEFLPFNTRLASKVVHSDQENSIVKARITEKMKVFDLFRFKDSLDVTVADSHSALHMDIGTLKFYDPFTVIIDDTTFRGFLNGYDILPYELDPAGYEDSETVQFAAVTTSVGGIGYLVQEASNSGGSVSPSIAETLIIYNKLNESLFNWADASATDGLPATDGFGNNADVTDGLPLLDSEGWDNAVFDITYGLDTFTNLDTIFEAQVTAGSLKIASPGSELYGTPYTNIPAALINLTRKVSRITIMKREISASSFVFYSDLSTLTQIPVTVVENTPNYAVVELTAPSAGKLVIF